MSNLLHSKLVKRANQMKKQLNFIQYALYHVSFKKQDLKNVPMFNYLQPYLILFEDAFSLFSVVEKLKAHNEYLDDVAHNASLLSKEDVMLLLALKKYLNRALKDVKNQIKASQLPINS